MCTKKSKEADSLFDRRKTLKLLGIGSLSVTPAAAFTANTAIPSSQSKAACKLYGTVAELRQDSSLSKGVFIRTLGYYAAGDGGAAEYVVRETRKTDTTEAILSLHNGLSAVLINVSSVNYKMFGAVGDGKNDDGVQIKYAHAFANNKKVPVINYYGEYWISETHTIIIETNVQWGQTIFHIDESYNSRDPRFLIRGTGQSFDIKLDDATKAAFLAQLKPGVKIIPELAPFKNHLIFINDKDDRIGFRAGKGFEGQSRGREEIFYVEEDGRIIGDIAWQFSNYTGLTAYPAGNSYLVVEGGTFYLSGNNPGVQYDGYRANGFQVNRSRTIIRNQWVGLENGAQDIARTPRSGFYSFINAYDVRLEDIRLIPWIHDRPGTKDDLPAGTYGISGNRILNATFRNITAEGSLAHWGVFGTNLNKNFRIEQCRLNRIDVHFHCWNLYVKDCSIGFKGINVTGGGELVIENTTCCSNRFINFRKDFGAKWDGDVYIRNCRFIPFTKGSTEVLSFVADNFDYKYPIGLAHVIKITDLTIDYSTIPDNNATCWLMRASPFSMTKFGDRLFFPQQIECSNIRVSGRAKGIRLIEISNPANYRLKNRGRYDGDSMTANALLVFSNIDLEKISGKEMQAEQVHISISSANNGKGDDFALYPEIRFSGCRYLAADFGNYAAEVLVENCIIGRIKGRDRLPGSYAFSNCRFKPILKDEKDMPYSVSATLGTSFVNCIIQVPEIDDEARPELVNCVGFIQVNKCVRFNHLGTRLDNRIVNHYKNKEMVFSSRFIAMLKAHHELEPEEV